MRSRLSIFSLAFLLLPEVRAEKFAIIIGINQYIAQQPLQGPVNDARALQRSLQSQWGFRPENIQLLTNAQASKAAILNSLDRVAARVRPGDFVFFFYSGHGTSYYAPGMSRARPELDIDTGAIVTADEDLIVGKLDLLPRLRKLDTTAQVFAVFDSCYSGNAIRSLALGRTKYIPPENLKNAPSPPVTAGYDSQFQRFGASTAIAAPYPYQKLIYLAAASKSEQAIDIRLEDIQHGRHATVDSQPHGALTNALLEGLAGAADTNQDKTISYSELHQYVRQAVTREFGHTPQLLFPPSDPSSIGTPVFGARPATFTAAASNGAAPQPTSSTTVRVRLEPPVSTALKSCLGALSTVRISSDAFDLSVKQTESGGWELYHRSGVLIADYAKQELDSLCHRIQVEPVVRRLAEWTYSRQDFNVTLDISPAGQGFFLQGQAIQLFAEAEAPCYILLLDIDSAGGVTVLHPLSPDAAAAPVGARTRVPLGVANQVTPPYGTDFVKLFAFRSKPAGWDEFLDSAKSRFSPSDQPFQLLMGLIRADQPGRSQSQLKLVTVGGLQ